jgi:hypothetical protein
MNKLNNTLTNTTYILNRGYMFGLYRLAIFMGSTQIKSTLRLSGSKAEAVRGLWKK